MVSSWRGTLGHDQKRAVPHGRLALAFYGLQELLSIGKDYPPEVAFQFITPVSRGPEEMARIHKEFAHRFISIALETISRHKQEADEWGPEQRTARQADAMRVQQQRSAVP